MLDKNDNGATRYARMELGVKHLRALGRGVVIALPHMIPVTKMLQEVVVKRRHEMGATAATK